MTEPRYPVVKLVFKYECGHSFNVIKKPQVRQVMFSVKCPTCGQGSLDYIGEVSVRAIYSKERDGDDPITVLQKGLLAQEPDNFELYYECGCTVEISNFDRTDPHCMDIDIPNTCAVHGAQYIGIRQKEKTQ